MNDEIKIKTFKEFVFESINGTLIRKMMLGSINKFYEF